MNSYTSKVIAPVIVGLTCFVLTVFSAQSQAVVVFNIFEPAAEIDGVAENVLMGLYDSYYESYSSNTEVLHLTGSASVFDTVMVDSLSSDAGALAKSAASVSLDTEQTVGGASTLTGSLSSSADVYESSLRNWYSYARGYAFFDVRFSLDDTYNYVFGGLGDLGLMEAGGEASFDYHLVNSDTNTDIFRRSLNNEEDSPKLSGTLLAGDYSLYMGALSEARVGSGFPIGFANGNFKFSLTVPSAVPAPATVWLFVSGLLAMVLVSRRREV